MAETHPTSTRSHIQVSGKKVRTVSIGGRLGAAPKGGGAAINPGINIPTPTGMSYIRITQKKSENISSEAEDSNDTSSCLTGGKYRYIKKRVTMFATDMVIFSSSELET